MEPKIEFEFRPNLESFGKNCPSANQNAEFGQGSNHNKDRTTSGSQSKYSIWFELFWVHLDFLRANQNTGFDLDFFALIEKNFTRPKKFLDFRID